MEDKNNKNVELNEEILIKKNRFSKISNTKNIFAKTYMRNMIFISCMLLTFLMVSYTYIIPFINKEFIKYDGIVLPNTYLNNVLIGNKDIDDISNNINNYLNEYKNKKVVFTNVNGTYEYNINDLNLQINNKEILDNIKNNTSLVNLIKRLIFGDVRREYQLEILDDDNLNNFLNEVKEQVNIEPKNGVFVRNDKYEVSFVGYYYGFVLDDDKFIELIKNSLHDFQEIIELPGEIINFDNYKLLDVNKKIVEFSTDYNSGTSARKKNVELAVKKLNGTVLYPDDIFSYYKIVGPYNANNGYHYYYNMVGSGVCQVSSTLYNVQLLAGVKTVYRAPHGKKVWYVDGGLDATVYGSYTDYKFKNNYEYPIYISAYTKNNNIYISFWSNEKVNENRYYKLRSIKTGNLSYKVYRDMYENGKVIKTEFINSTSYSSSY